MLTTKVIELKTYIQALSDFTIETEIDTYDHIGALIVDAILQSGIKYDTVVKPRAERIQRDYPDANTTTGFLKILSEIAPTTLLEFKGDKPIRVLEVACFFKYCGVETTEDLRVWINASENKNKLMKIKGIKNKTADYFGILAGQDTNAVDRHLINFLKNANIICQGYGEIQDIINHTADLMNLSRSQLDHSIWTYMSERKTN